MMGLVQFQLSSWLNRERLGMGPTFPSSFYRGSFFWFFNNKILTVDLFDQMKKLDHAYRRLQLGTVAKQVAPINPINTIVIGMRVSRA